MNLFGLFLIQFNENEYLVVHSERKYGYSEERVGRACDQKLKNTCEQVSYISREKRAVSINRVLLYILKYIKKKQYHFCETVLSKCEDGHEILSFYKGDGVFKDLSQTCIRIVSIRIKSDCVLIARVANQFLETQDIFFHSKNVMCGNCTISGNPAGLQVAETLCIETLS